jgi:2-haloacid dehalogenase
MSKIEAVVFDIGNVLIEWNPDRLFDAILGPERRKALFSEVDLAGMNDAIDMGAPFKETIYGVADQNPDWRDEIRLWHDRWIEMASPAIDHTVRLQRALRAKGVPVHALTNFGVDSFYLAERHYPFFAEFDQRFVSGLLEVMKPDPKIYEIVEAETGLAPETMLFTDDRADNIAAAQARGWQVHRFDGSEGLAARLVAEGLLSEAEAA